MILSSEASQRQIRSRYFAAICIALGIVDLTLGVFFGLSILNLKKRS
jgi:hypothetical protein